MLPGLFWIVPGTQVQQPFDMPVVGFSGNCVTFCDVAALHDNVSQGELLAGHSLSVPGVVAYPVLTEKRKIIVIERDNFFICCTSILVL